MRRAIGWLWVIGTGVVVVDCGGQTTLTVDQPQPSRDAGDLDSSTPVNTDAADANAPLTCVGDFDATPPTLCIEGEVCAFSGTTGQGGCEPVPAGCVIRSQACANQLCGNETIGRWCNDRAVACFEFHIY